MIVTGHTRDYVPTCGSTGAARVAANTAAIETIKAGYDKYIIVPITSDAKR